MFKIARYLSPTPFAGAERNSIVLFKRSSRPCERSHSERGHLLLKISRGESRDTPSIDFSHLANVVGIPAIH